MLCTLDKAASGDSCTAVLNGFCIGPAVRLFLFLTFIFLPFGFCLTLPFKFFLALTFLNRSSKDVDNTRDILCVLNLGIINDVFCMDGTAIGQINAGTAVLAIHELTIVIGNFKVGTAIGTFTSAHGIPPATRKKVYRKSITVSETAVKWRKALHAK